jgi:hypothetical protein
MTILGLAKGVQGGGLKKPARFNPDRLVIENGLSNLYSEPNPFFNAISTILSTPEYTQSFQVSGSKLLCYTPDFRPIVPTGKSS